VPTVVGVIREVEFVGSATAVLTLATGQQVQVDFDTADNLYYGTPQVGDLLLYGEDAGGPWFAALPPAGELFELLSQPVGWDPGRTMTFEFGLRLRRAAKYREPGYGYFEPGAPVTYLVNDRGEVVGRS